MVGMPPLWPYNPLCRGAPARRLSSSLMNLQILPILKYPDPRLRRSSEEVGEFGEDLHNLAMRMLQTMRQKNGVGLAGPQVGFMQRIFVCNPTGEPKDDLIVVNPRLSDLQGILESEEGCLSIPEVHVPIRRAQHCKLNATDAFGKAFEVVAEDLLARVWQHESDHLNGRLILDYMTEASSIANRRVIKHLEMTFRE